MDLGMSREIQVSMPMPMPSNYHHQQHIQQIYNKGLAGVVEGMSPPEDLRSQVQSMRPPPHVHVHETVTPTTRAPPPPVLEDMRTHHQQHQRQYPQHGTNRNNNNNNNNAEVISMPNKPVRYRECRKNHAASIGGYAVDGCGEFMPGGEEGTPAALKCAACNCHRNFHRREVEGEARCDCHHTRR